MSSTEKVGRVETRPGHPSSLMALCVGAIAIVGVVLVMPALTRGAGSSGPGYQTSVEVGLSPKWTADAAATAALREIANNEQRLGRRLVDPKIRSVAAVASATAAARVGYVATSGPGVVWIVEADGTFVGYFGRHGVPSSSGTSGYLAFDDSGRLVGSGFPLP